MEQMSMLAYCAYIVRQLVKCEFNKTLWINLVTAQWLRNTVWDECTWTQDSGIYQKAQDAKGQTMTKM
jgi:hypothetical protein